MMARPKMGWHPQTETANTHNNNLSKSLTTLEQPRTNKQTFSTLTEKAKITTAQSFSNASLASQKKLKAQLHPNFSQFQKCG